MARFTVQFDDEIEKILSDLAKTRKTTKAEILRRALASYSFLDKERQNKKKIIIMDDTDQIIKEVILP
jgi:predicted transcriptional regulator